MPELTARAAAWAGTMAGHADAEVVRAHADSAGEIRPGEPVGRQAREESEAALLRPGAAIARGAGSRAVPEEPDAERTCFERDRDRIVHSTAFRRLAGKTQVVVFPTDHQRTRLTHALEVAQVATSIARGVGANATLAEAIALGHDCGHGPGGHASEDAFDAFLPEGYDHGPWGADVVLTSLNLCAETLDGVRNHSWSRPSPATIEGEIVSWADRIAYCAHDLEDAVGAGIVGLADLPGEVVEVCGSSRREQLGSFVRAVVAATSASGRVSMAAEPAAALASLRAFNYERIYTRPESLAQSEAVIAVLTALVEFYCERPELLPADLDAAGLPASGRVRAAVTYVGGMTDRFAFDAALTHLGWDADRLPKGQ
ncbi:MAG: HD domain-containing protein [Propionicimonas sp.]|nr:HD domain-containing protein [Propionicimonas sp.]